MNWPVDYRKFPGVSVMTFPHPEDGGGEGMDFHATFTAHAKVTLPAVEIERVAVLAGRSALGDLGGRMAHQIANLVMRAAALIVLRHVHRDWTGFFGIGMEIIDRRQVLRGTGDKRGRATRVDYLDRRLTVAWNFNLDGPTDQEIAFDDALTRFERRDWDLP